jgi:hypothetical protein
MIHFKCRCGTTLSAPEAEAGHEVTCALCGERLSIPGPNGDAKLPESPAEHGAHDFDAEINGAARSAPARPRRTPSRVTATRETVPPPAARGDYDLLALDSAAGAIPRLTWVALACLGFVAAAVLLPDPLPEWGRVAAAVCALFVAIVLARALVILKDVCRAVAGLAAMQRDLVRTVVEEE